jgi:hypothetical protein
LGLIGLEFPIWEEKIERMMSILPPRATPDKPKLLDQVRDVIRRKQYSIRTERTSPVIVEG